MTIQQSDIVAVATAMARANRADIDAVGDPPERDIVLYHSAAALFLAATAALKSLHRAPEAKPPKATKVKRKR